MRWFVGACPAGRPQPPGRTSASSTATRFWPPLENNGFTIVDFLRDRIEFQMFRWKMDQPESLLDNLPPFHRFTEPRP